MGIDVSATPEDPQSGFVLVHEVTLDRKTLLSALLLHADVRTQQLNTALAREDDIDTRQARQLNGIVSSGKHAAHTQFEVFEAASQHEGYRYVLLLCIEPSELDGTVVELDNASAYHYYALIEHIDVARILDDYDALVVSPVIVYLPIGLPDDIAADHALAQFKLARAASDQS